MIEFRVTKQNKQAVKSIVEGLCMKSTLKNVTFMNFVSLKLKNCNSKTALLTEPQAQQSEKKVKKHEMNIQKKKKNKTDRPPERRTSTKWILLCLHRMLSIFWLLSSWDALPCVLLFCLFQFHLIQRDDSSNENNDSLHLHWLSRGNGKCAWKCRKHSPHDKNTEQHKNKASHRTDRKWTRSDREKEPKKLPNAVDTYKVGNELEKNPHTENKTQARQMQREKERKEETENTQFTSLAMRNTSAIEKGSHQRDKPTERKIKRWHKKSTVYLFDIEKMFYHSQTDNAVSKWMGNHVSFVLLISIYPHTKKSTRKKKYVYIKFNTHRLN